MAQATCPSCTCESSLHSSPYLALHGYVDGQTAHYQLQSAAQNQWELLGLPGEHQICSGSVEPSFEPWLLYPQGMGAHPSPNVPDQVCHL